jgi:hypothetical protein
MNRHYAALVRRFTFVCLLLCPLVGGGTRASAQEAGRQWLPLKRDEQIAALQLISAKIKENHSRIRTWTGSYRLDEVNRLQGQTAERLARQSDPDASTEGVAYLKLVRANCDFVVDLDEDRLFSSLKEHESAKLVDAHSGETVNISLGKLFQNSIITPHEFLKFEPEIRTGATKRVLPPNRGELPSSGRTAYREQPHVGKKELTTMVVDPRTFLFDYPATDSSGRFARMLQSDDPKDVERTRATGFRVTRATVGGNTLYRVAHHSPTADGTDIAVERIFSEAAGHNPVNEAFLVLPARTLVQHREWDYEKFGGIDVPRTHRLRLLTLDGNTTRFDRTWTMVKTRLNERVDRKTFTVDRLGLGNGDRFVDHIDNTQSIYRNGDLTRPDDGRGSVLQRIGRIAAFSSPTMLLVLAILVRRRRKRAGAAMRR